MPEYEQSAFVEAPAEAVFEFVTNLNNLPRFLPALREAQNVGGNAVRLQAAIDKGTHDASGYVHVDETEFFMEWHTDTDMHYSGWLEVQELDEGCDVTVHLSYNPEPLIAERVNAQSHAAEIEAGLKTALSSVKSICEESSGRLQIDQR